MRPGGLNLVQAVLLVYIIPLALLSRPCLIIVILFRLASPGFPHGSSPPEFSFSVALYSGLFCCPLAFCLSPSLLRAR